MTKHIFSILFTVLTLISIRTTIYAFPQYGATASLAIGTTDLSECNMEPGMQNYLRGFSANYGLPRVYGGYLIAPLSNDAKVNFYRTSELANFMEPEFTLGVLSKCRRFPNQTEVPPYLGTWNIQSVFFDGTYFYTSDRYRNRVLMYQGVPTSWDAPPYLVLGQPDMSTITANTGGISARSLSAPYGIYSDGTHLYVADMDNNRVLVWDGLPTSNYEAADYVIGQPNFTTGTANTGGLSAQTLSGPRGIHYDGTYFYVADYANNRILAYTGLPLTNNPAATFQIGQPNMTSSTANNTSLSAAQRLNTPTEVFTKDNKMFIGDRGNNRIVIHDPIPSSSAPAGALVVGQNSLTGISANQGGSVGANTLSTPYGAYVDDSGKMYIPDFGNNRILIFNSVPTANNASADIVIGQPNMTSGAAYAKEAVTSQSIRPDGIVIADNKLFITDVSSSRVLMYDDFDTNYPVPTGILGQNNYTASGTNMGTSTAAANTLNNPRGVIFANNKLIVNDFGNHRILMYDGIPATTAPNANLVIGQANFSGKSANRGTSVANNGLNFQIDIASNGTQFAIADTGNHRVLIWDTFPTSNGQAADRVLGQANFTSNSSNRGGSAAANTLATPYSVFLTDSKILVADSNNNRVLIWNTLTPSNGQAADVVIGQDNFTDVTVNKAGTTNINTLAGPGSLIVDNEGILWITDRLNNRILGYYQIPTGNNASADIIVGQPDATSNSKTSVGDAQGLLRPVKAYRHENMLYVSDEETWRVTRYELNGPTSEAFTVQRYTNSQTVTLNFNAQEAKDMMISESPSFTGASWEPYASSKNFTLSDGDGDKVIYVKFRDYALIEGNTLNSTNSGTNAGLVLDTVAPNKLKIQARFEGEKTSQKSLIGDQTIYTKDKEFTLKFDAKESTSRISQIMISTHKDFRGASWRTYDGDNKLKLSGEDGKKKVYIKVRDNAGNESITYTQTIKLDTTAPEIKLKKVGWEDCDRNYKIFYHNQSNPILAGTTEMKAWVKIYVNGIQYGDQVTSEENDKGEATWSIGGTGLNAGNNFVHIESEDPAGNKAILELNLIIN